MTGMKDLFGDQPHKPKPEYPDRAGFTEPTTSKEAAEKVESRGRAGAMRERLLTFFRGGGRGTVHEIAASFKEPVASIQPRFSELRAQGLIVPSGERRKNATNASAHVWMIKP